MPAGKLGEFQEQRAKLQQEAESLSSQITQLNKQIEGLTHNVDVSPDYVRDVLQPLYIQLGETKRAHENINKQIENLNRAISALESSLSS